MEKPIFTKLSLSLPNDLMVDLDKGRMARAAELRTHLSANQYLVRLLRLGLEKDALSQP
ncbi:hypothetical protein [Sphingomonas sanguinis]|jgi:hypothetical protein|uniref:CopG family transcriptional regulator n=1 Tax=Sphingomonas sanguinis TaxID=33051 RepID=A0A7Y7QTJ0_9SPHN|nr:hypothetical protein [Sphingomonas sanguinis]MBZ6381123.1 hypothetical protein [Sphingomonas sanguinis]NNG51273.1 hypothetical protein [Sphingomonas sanguinis]NNG55223.1 hypothetical protein [Sphingomonas sanguinis]NVP30425.1 hypothetical protein [Sphingomonas sanguinis]